jgi:hypothetical protein
MNGDPDGLGGRRQSFESSFAIAPGGMAVFVFAAVPPSLPTIASLRLALTCRCTAPFDTRARAVEEWRRHRARSATSRSPSATAHASGYCRTGCGRSLQRGCARRSCASIVRVAPDLPRMIPLPERHHDGRSSIDGVMKPFGVSRHVVPPPGSPGGSACGRRLARSRREVRSDHRSCAIAEQL